MAKPIKSRKLFARNDLSAERLRELLYYDPKSGIFIRLVKTSNRIKAGEIAGWTSEGYRSVSIEGRTYRAHRLAWLYMTGKWPNDEIDHWDLDTLNNRWGNLREATHGQNQANSRAYKNNRSGVKGVCFHKMEGKWRAQVNVNGKRTYLGSFETINEARAVYNKAAAKIFGKFARTS